VEEEVSSVRKRERGREGRKRIRGIGEEEEAEEGNEEGEGEEEGKREEEEI
jgi:hypothetical protein